MNKMIVRCPRCRSARITAMGGYFGCNNCDKTFGFDDDKEVEA